MSKLDQEEKEIAAAYERGELKSIEDLPHVLKRHRKAAASTLKKNGRVNVRIPRWWSTF